MRPKALVQESKNSRKDETNCLSRYIFVLWVVVINREFVNDEKFKILHTFSSYEETSEWVEIMDKYLKRCGLGGTIVINLIL